MKKYGTHFCRLQKQSNTLLSAIKDTSVIFAGTHSADPNVFVEVGFFSCELLPWTIFFKAGTLDRSQPILLYVTIQKELVDICAD